MSVKCLTPEEKKDIAVMYAAKTMNQQNLATAFMVSERTINRVLIEAGLATPTERKNGEAYQALQIINKYGFSVKDLEILLKANTTNAVNEFVEEHLASLTDAELIRLFNTIHKRKNQQANERSNEFFQQAA